MDAGRRGVLATLGAGAAVLLGGCMPWRRSLEAAIRAAVEEVPGVTGSALRYTTGAEFSRLVAGTIRLAPTTEGEALDVYDLAMRAVVTVLHDRDEPDIVIGGVTGEAADGTTFDPLRLDPEFPTSQHRLDYVSARSLYARYGLT